LPFQNGKKIENPKFEARNSKQIQMIKTGMTETREHGFDFALF